MVRLLNAEGEQMEQLDKLLTLTEGFTNQETLAFLEDGAALAACGITDQDAVEELYNEINAKYGADA